MKGIKKIIIGLAVALTVFTADSSWAQDLSMRYSPRLMQGMRPMGMGGAFIAVDGTDENVLFYNPAAINDFEKKIHMQFALPTVEFSAKAIPFFSSDLPELGDDLDAAATDANRVGVFNQFAADNMGRYEEVAVHGSLANFMHKYLAASIFYDNRSVLALLNPASTTVSLESVSHGGLQVGSAYSFFDDMLKVGGAAKFVVRHLVDEEITQRDVEVNDGLDDAINFRDVGFGVGFDVGVKAKLPISGKAWEFLDPTFALTLQDVADTRFFAGDNVGRIDQSLTAGFALHPNFWKLKSNFAVDFRDLEHQRDFLNKFHAGYEVTWPEISKVLRSVSLRAGVNQGYVTGGLGLDFKYFKFNFATYGREIGQFTRVKQSRIFGFQLAAGF